MGQKAASGRSPFSKSGQELKSYERSPGKGQKRQVLVGNWGGESAEVHQKGKYERQQSFHLHWKIFTCK